MSCPTKCQLRMCPPQTHAGRARVRSGAGLGRTVHSTMSMKCAHQDPIAKVHFENARGSRAFSDCNEGMVAPCTGPCRWVIPIKCRLQNLPFKNARGWRAFSDCREVVGRSVQTAPPLLNSRCTKCQCISYGTANARGTGAFLNGEHRLKGTADLWNATIWPHWMESQLKWTKGGACFRKVKRRLPCSTMLRTM